MSSIEISIPQPRYLASYCSQSNTPQLDSVKTMEDIIQVTDTILAKTCLCPHDILQLNRIYETVDQVEKSEKSAALEKSGLKIIEEVQKKVQSILDPPAEDSAHSNSEKSAQDFINLYHLSHFSTLAPYGGSIMRKMKEKEEIKNIPKEKWYTFFLFAVRLNCVFYNHYGCVPQREPLNKGSLYFNLPAPKNLKTPSNDMQKVSTSTVSLGSTLLGQVFLFF